MPGSPKRRAKREMQAAIAAGQLPIPKRARTRSSVDVAEPETATGPDTGAHARTPVRSLPDGLSEEQLDSILTAISCGVTLEAALASVRVPRSSMYMWMERNDELRALIEDARESWARAHVEFIAQSADWKARSWLLGVRLPKQYAPTSKLAGHDGGALLADAELLELARRALGVVPPDGDAGED